MWNVIQTFLVRKYMLLLVLERISNTLLLLLLLFLPRRSHDIQLVISLLWSHRVHDEVAPLQWEALQDASAKPLLSHVCCRSCTTRTATGTRAVSAVLSATSLWPPSPLTPAMTERSCAANVAPYRTATVARAATRWSCQVGKLLRPVMV